jgi:hypothetical protein
MIEYTVKVYPEGYKAWYLNGKRHREDGPAIELANGNKSWYLNGKQHREDGPATEYSNGDKCWFVNDKLHREDGPAIEYSNGDKCWFLNDKQLTEAEHKAATSPKVTCNGKEVVIDGITYILKESK